MTVDLTWLPITSPSKQPLLRMKISALFAFLVSFAFLFVGGSAGTSPEGLKFLEQNAQKEGVKVTASGLQYKIIESGPAGGKSPAINTPTECHYKGTTIEGVEFDSSFKRGKPTTFAPNQVIKGWTEAMQLMKEGDTWELYIPSELAYGDRQTGQHITPGAVLIFTLQMINVKGPGAQGEL